MAIFALVEAKALPEYRLHLRYADGTEGDVDVSRLVGRGVFKAWKDPGVFESVRIGDAGDLMWGDDIDLCADKLYLKLTNQEPEDIFPGLGKPASHA